MFAELLPTSKNAGPRIPDRAGRMGKKRQRYANLPHLSRYRLFMALRRYDLLDFWLAGGEGAKIMHEARSKLNKYRDRKRVRPASGSHSRYPRGTGVVGGSRLRAF